MSGMQWGRLYGEWAHDLKIQTLPEAYQRRHAMLLCMHIEGLLNPTDEEAAFYMRIEPAEWLESKAVFLAKGLMDESNHLINWERRQFKSDSAAVRMRKYRERLDDRNGYVTVTSPETDTESETETEPEEKNSPPTPPAGGAADRSGGPAVASEKFPDPAEANAPPESIAVTEQSSPGPQPAGRDPAWAKVAEAYHRLLPHLPPHQVWSDRDVRHFLRNRKLDPARGRPEFWSENIFPLVARSPFLSGRCPPKRGLPWKASLPWLLNPDNVAKILNGQYAGNEPSPGRPGSGKAGQSTTGGRSAAQTARLPAPEEFAHAIRPLGSKSPAEKN